MRRFTVKGRYQPLAADEVVTARGRFRARFMAEELTHVFVHEHADDEGVLVGVGDGQFEIQIDGFPELMVSARSGGRVWVDVNQRDQSIIIEQPISFTTLDRPAPVSPEVRYMQQMMMANSKMRDEILNERRRIEQEARRLSEVVATDGVGKKGRASEKKAEQVAEGSPDDPEGQKIPGGAETPVGSAVVEE